MLTTIAMPEICAAERNPTDPEDDSSDCDFYEASLSDENENYVRGISTMTIDESATGAHLNNQQQSEETTMETESDDDSSADNESSYELANLFDNDIVFDQEEEEMTITELVEASTGPNGSLMQVQNSHMRIAFGIILRLVLPLANGVARSIKGIRDVRFLRVLKGIASSRQALTNLLAFAANTISMNLSTVQVSHRIEPILKLLKIRKAREGVESLPDSPTPGTPPVTPTTPTFSVPLLQSPKGTTLPNFGANSRKPSMPEKPAPKCCNLKILAEPPAGEPIRADIIFIHGLHGSLANTWKQGLWENERRPVEFPRPPKPPVRPPKRARHSRTTCIRPPHKQKRARFANKEDLNRHSTDFEEMDYIQDSNAQTRDLTYICSGPEDIKICDGVEYSFPALRIRMNDNGRLLQAEIKTILNDENSSDNSEDSKIVSQALGKDVKSKGKTKMTPNDPNYSKCWPGDWLPLDCPGVRVIAVNYTTDQYLWRPLWKEKESRTNLIQRAREMAELLIEHRVGYGHPIVWVGHSKGGLFVKQIIVDAWESGRPAMEPFWRSARGCFFYSVPHRGSHLASVKAPLLTRSVELIDIEKNSKYLLDLHRRFAGLYHLGHLKIEVFSFVETALTLMSVLYLRIVGVDSADPGIGDVCGIRLDHREICKPRNRDCILYKELVKMIKKVC